MGHSYILLNIMGLDIMELDILGLIPYLLCRLCLSFSSLITLPQTLYVSLRSQAPQKQYSVLAWPKSQTDGITLWAYLSQMHRPNLRYRYYTVGIPFSDAYRPNLRYYTEGIPFWTSCKRQSQMSKFYRNIMGSNSRDHTFTITYVLRRGIWKDYTWKNGRLSRGKFKRF